MWAYRMGWLDEMRTTTAAATEKTPLITVFATGRPTNY